MWNALLGGVFGIGLLTVLGHRIGRSLFSEEKKGIATVMGSLVAVALFSIAGAIVYYVFPVTLLTYSITAACLTGSILWMTAKDSTTPHPTASEPFSVHVVLPTIMVLLGLGAWWSALLTHPITEAVRTPWSVLSPVSIIAPVLALLGGFLILRTHKTLGTLLLGTTFFSLFASAAVLFPLGYGFDPYLHRATMMHIAEHGTITPKPLYYIGEYAIELFAHLLGGFPLFTLDVFLLPILATLTGVIAIRRLPIGISFLLLGIGNFLTTTPQSLGYLFAVLTVLTSAEHPTTRWQYIAPLIFAIAAGFAHPIAGVPACAFVLFTFLKSPIARWGLVVANAIALPAMFILQATLNHAPIGIAWSTLWRLDLLPLTAFFWRNGNTWLDAMYLVLHNLHLLIALLAIGGLIAFRHHLTDREKQGAIVAGTLVASFVLVSLGIDFTYLISYERQDFALRFLLLASLFLLPIVDRVLATAAQALQTKKLGVLVTLLSTLLFSAVIYGMFPRHDGYARSAAFNVSQADVDAVYSIHEKESEDADYIVLSNQTTAAAALQEFGFRKYYRTDIFYYPIPTGGVLYQQYLALMETENTTRAATVLRALNIPCVDTAYVVVNDYWWKSQEVIENLKLITEEWFVIDDGNVTIFTFTREGLNALVQQPPCTP